MAAMTVLPTDSSTGRIKRKMTGLLILITSQLLSSKLGKGPNASIKWNFRKKEMLLKQKRSRDVGIAMKQRKLSLSN